MPEVIGPIIGFLSSVGGGSALAGAGTLAGLASTGVSLGKELSGGGGAPQQPAAQPPTAQQIAAENAPKIAAISSMFPSLQEQVGGALAPDIFAEFGGREAGFPGEPGLAQTALQNWLGIGGDTTGGAGGAAAPLVPPPELPTRGGGELALFPTEGTSSSSGLSGGFS